MSSTVSSPSVAMARKPRDCGCVREGCSISNASQLHARTAQTKDAKPMPHPNSTATWPSCSRKEHRTSP
eukprot:scaffold48_cov311-Pinguiococcus_pyrenoidosus.AAC.77